ncbi:MAG: formylglycine-generating enzyme family protein [Bacteroidaceae bacterium]|nr:formylglycine-generating enzyme family protein [Bacteroidaceae bacterium]
MKKLILFLLTFLLSLPVGAQSTSNATKRTAVETLYGYLKIFPNELGVFKEEPVNVIRQINAQAQRGYNNWRIPTEEELSLLRANGYLGSGKYMTKESKTGIVLLVSDGESYRTIREQERQRDFVETASGLNMKMVYVEGGSFLMRATAEQGADGESDEQVIRRIRLDSYYIGECEVTQAQWTKVMGTSVEQQRNKANSSWSLYGVGPDYPIYYVSWEEATEFCRELSRMTGRTYRLPTEAQWEYAARGGKKADGTKYSGGPIDAVAWYGGNSGGGTHPVKNKRANGLGLYDMSGNVWEWCLDWYSNSYNVNDTNNPTGPSSGSNRVERGGSWNNDARNCRVSNRVNNSPGSRFSNVGFRVVVIP